MNYRTLRLGKTTLVNLPKTGVLGLRPVMSPFQSCTVGDFLHTTNLTLGSDWSSSLLSRKTVNRGDPKMITFVIQYLFGL